MTHIDRRGVTALLLLTLTGLLVACSDDVADPDPGSGENPPEAAGGFLGYSSVSDKKAVCGNCHTGKQAAWRQTAHATAWAGLRSSGSAQKLCEACHTVSSLGNLVTEENVGWVATQNPRYQDVQCESCHGPGLTHVLNPDAVGTKPLAPIAVGTDLSRGCGECHSGAHRPFVEEWSGSGHAALVGYRQTNPSCVGCHDAPSILRGWGIKSTFLEEAEAGEHAVTCAVCHDPHDNRNQGQLRFPLNVADEEQNLCMKCHHKRGEPDPTTWRGPHSPEGPLLLGTAGWFPPNFNVAPGAMVGSHGSQNNPRLCATCHVNDYEVRDALTDKFTFRTTGHSFKAIPCVDAQGIPTGEHDCELTQRSFRSCTECHLSESGARSALTTAEMRLERLAAEVESLLDQVQAGWRTCRTNDSCGAGSPFDSRDGAFTTAEGAAFNAELARKKGSAAHNPFLLEALLIATIQQIKTDYGLASIASLSLTPELAPR